MMYYFKLLKTTTALSMARMRVAEANSDTEDMAVPDDGPVVPHQSLAHTVVVPPRGVP